MTPLEDLHVIGQQQVEVAPGLTHHELFTPEGLLSVLWHGEPAAEDVVLCVGGAMGGLLGPAGGLYQELGVALAGQGAQVLRLSYRVPNDLARCVHDAAAVAELACRHGGRRVAVLGHSFGGAVAVQLAAALPDVVCGVATFATQSAGCEVAGAIPEDIPLRFFHGDRDELLAPECSFVVRELAGHGEVVVLPGEGHLLAGAGEALLAELLAWLPTALSRQ